MVEAFLPSMERAIVLCDLLLEHLSWMFHIVSRQHMVDELIPAVYKQTRVSYGPHDLALLLIVLGIGALVDLDLPPYNLEAQHYYRLAKAAVTLQPVLGQQSIVTIKVAPGPWQFAELFNDFYSISKGNTSDEHFQWHERQGEQSGAVVYFA
jgi:hypothetical protein